MVSQTASRFKQRSSTSKEGQHEQTIAKNVSQGKRSHGSRASV
jgi:hypothetical protein